MSRSAVANCYALFTLLYRHTYGPYHKPNWYHGRSERCYSEHLNLELTENYWTTWPAAQCCFCWTSRPGSRLSVRPNSGSGHRKTSAWPCVGASASACWCEIVVKTTKNRRSQHSKECNGPRRQYFYDSWPWPLTFWPQNKWISRTHRGTFLCHVRCS